MKNSDAFQNGYKQGALDEVEQLIDKVNSLKNSTQIWDLQQAYQIVLDTLTIRRKSLMLELNWTEIKDANLSEI